jgi:hypothetical protein
MDKMFELINTKSNKPVKPGKLYTPDELASSGNESGAQRALFLWANIASEYGYVLAQDDRIYTNPDFVTLQSKPHYNPFVGLKLMYAIPNQIPNPVVAARMKAEGVKSGVPDIFLPVARYGKYGLYIELKRQKSLDKKKAKGVISTNQTAYALALIEHGYQVEISYGWEAARDVLIRYML